MSQPQWCEKCGDQPAAGIAEVRLLDGSTHEHALCRMCFDQVQYDSARARRERGEA